MTSLIGNVMHTNMNTRNNNDMFAKNSNKAVKNFAFNNSSLNDNNNKVQHMNSHIYSSNNANKFHIQFVGSGASNHKQSSGSSLGFGQLKDSINNLALHENNVLIPMGSSSRFSANQKQNYNHTQFYNKNFNGSHQKSFQNNSNTASKNYANYSGNSNMNQYQYRANSNNQFSQQQESKNSFPFSANKFNNNFVNSGKGTGGSLF